jgi:hypothetical protein
VPFAARVVALGLTSESRAAHLSHIGVGRVPVAAMFRSRALHLYRGGFLLTASRRLPLAATICAAMIIFSSCQVSSGYTSSHQGGLGGGPPDTETTGAVATTASTTPSTLTLAFSKKTIGRSKKISLNVVLDTHGRDVNSVQVYLTLPANRLRCAAAPTVANSQFTIVAVMCTSKVAALAINTSTDQPFTGKAKIATVLLASDTKKGKAGVTAQLKRSFIVSADTNQNTLAKAATAKVTVK